MDRGRENEFLKRGRGREERERDNVGKDINI